MYELSTADKSASGGWGLGVVGFDGSGTVCMRVTRQLDSRVLTNGCGRSRQVPDIERCTILLRMGTGAAIGTCSLLTASRVVCGGQNLNCFISTKTGGRVGGAHGGRFVGRELPRLTQRVRLLSVSVSRIGRRLRGGLGGVGV